MRAWKSLEALSVAQVARLALSGAALAADVIAMPGEFAIQTVHPGIYNGFYLTAVDGGGRTENAIHTDARWIRSWELFRLSFDPSTGHYGIQTATNNFVTAVSGGGRTTDVIHTDATQLQSWEKFRFEDAPPTVTYPDFHYTAIRTFNGHYVTAVGGGGKAENAIHTDATNIGTWERFWIWKCGDLGSKYRYAIWDPTNGRFMAATGGGGRIKSVISYPGPNSPREWGGFTLLRQDDGTYALRTASGNYLTAVGGGGLASGTPESDNLHTDATWIRAWETFRLIDQGNCTYAIQTVSGFYLASEEGRFSTRIDDINAATKFRLTMIDLPSYQ
jgi:hypothetical protein